MPAQNKILRTPQASKTQPTPATKKAPLQQQQQNGGHNRTPSTATPTKNAKRNSVNVSSMAPTVALLDYDKVQRDEVEVLKSIFMDDYEHVETTGAWNVSWLFKITYCSILHTIPKGQGSNVYICIR